MDNKDSQFAPIYDREEETWSVKRKLDNGQTLYMALQRTDATNHADYWNIVLCVYTKRRHFDRAFDHVLMTGKNPVATVHLARSMFVALENAIVDRTCRDYKNVIYCTWLDNRRRDAYYRFLHRRGYQYGMLFGQKAIYKVFPAITASQSEWRD